VMAASLGLGRLAGATLVAAGVCVRDEAARERCTDDGVTWSPREAGAAHEGSVREGSGRDAAEARTRSPSAAIGTGGAGASVAITAAAVTAAAATAAAPEAITAERLIQDLHALRFLGGFADMLAALFGLALIVLGVTGLWTAIRPGRRPGRAGRPR